MSCLRCRSRPGTSEIGGTSSMPVPLHKMCAVRERGEREGLGLADGQVDAMKPLQFVSLYRQLRPQVRRTAAALSMTRLCNRAQGKVAPCRCVGGAIRAANAELSEEPA